MRCKVDLAKGSLANESTNTVVADRPKVFGRELAGQKVSMSVICPVQARLLEKLTVRAGKLSRWSHQLLRDYAPIVRAIPCLFAVVARRLSKLLVAYVFRADLRGWCVELSG